MHVKTTDAGLACRAARTSPPPGRPRHLSTARARFTLPVTGSIITQGMNPE